MARNKYSEETVELIVHQALKLFMEKGYENTSIQDIINNLGGLSKGAIYHHFKSKEEIFGAVCDKIGKKNTAFFNIIRDNKNTTGAQKLQEMLSSVYDNPNHAAVRSVARTLVEDPKFLMMNIRENYDLVAPEYIQPIIEEGVRDGSITTHYPKELAQVLITLLNLWMNPLINKVTCTEDVRNRMDFFKIICTALGADVLTDEIMEKTIAYIESYLEDENQGQAQSY